MDSQIGSERTFLPRVLHEFGFSQSFVDWVRTILHSARLSVLINGSPHGFFSCDRGVRQGDPLSTILFCLAEEVLSRGLANLFSAGRIRSISTPRGCSPISHVLYADDLFIFCRGDGSSLRCLQQFLTLYGEASGQLINKNKSTFYLGTPYLHRQRYFKRLLGFKRGVTPFTYLGVRIFRGKPRRIHLQALADKAKSKLAGWKGKLLSMAGRVQLVQSVFQSMLLHTFTVYIWPSSLIKHLAVCAPNFIWSGDLAIRKMVTVPWSQNSRWLIGNGSMVNFWSDKWLDIPILEELQRVSLSPQLHALVSDFIANQQWSLPARFYSLYPHIAQKIHNITLPLQAESDCLIWEHSSFRVPSFYDGYELWLACCFGTSLPSQGSLDDFWNAFIGKRFSSQLANVWLAAGLFTLMQIWKVRNKLVFDNKQPSLWRVLCSIKYWVRFAAPYFPGSSKGLLDVNILKEFGVQPIIQQVRIPCMVRWLSPTHSWIKLNTDGLAKVNPGAAACGGIFRIAGGRYVRGYCQNLGFQNAFYSELMAVIIGVEFTYQFGWHTLC
ncbi:uncharacterized protein LOC112184393 [Rosa chinensis]|uniref:uncharacterized protein LOC112184393 n=1 Tax=Rosa chinensis TaxID=74649 RepID=UPI000D08AE03|nr:uncharacterized protein LOC112184393 [Rosa chinensis]